MRGLRAVRTDLITTFESKITDNPLIRQCASKPSDVVNDELAKSWSSNWSKMTVPSHGVVYQRHPAA